MRGHLVTLVGAMVLAGCAATRQPAWPQPGAALDDGSPAMRAMAQLRLPPALREADVALSQRLSVSSLAAPRATPEVVDVQLEIDAQGLRLAGFAMGMRVLSLRWDGAALKEERHPRLPSHVDGQRILRDLSLVYWPAQALRAQLAPGCELQESAQQRQLWCDGQLQWRLQWQGQLLGQSQLQIENFAEQYRLTIESQPVGGDA
ncbi:DUF3261 domain-containing protein [Roseateles sp. BYS180W]|uniref:DUF3261 domain-containing protein n=1 Tax=Roseateles rivi TaxID=3299028 RepID=A0ABW7FQW0_9BURK